ncbi:hypothetical protein [Streptomyces sp. H72]
MPLLLATALAASMLSGCSLMDLARDCEGTDARITELATLDILHSRPHEAAVARGFETVDTGCWADSGDVVVSAERIYAFPGTRAEVAAHYRAAAPREGWRPDPVHRGGASNVRPGAASNGAGGLAGRKAA